MHMGKLIGPAPVTQKHRHKFVIALVILRAGKHNTDRQEWEDIVLTLTSNEVRDSQKKSCSQQFETVQVSNKYSVLNLSLHNLIC